MNRLLTLVVALLLAGCGAMDASPDDQPTATDNGAAATEPAATNGTDDGTAMSCEEAVAQLPEPEELDEMALDASVEAVRDSLEACASVEEWRMAWGDPGVTEQEAEALLSDICEGAADLSGTDICAELNG